MPNTKSAVRRMHNSARKQDRNLAVKSKLKTLEHNYLEQVKAGNKETATKALREVTSALDKAAKGGVIHRCKADRKKSRLTVKLAVKAS
jgi:small subunit ribosomal protein S20